MGSLKKDVNFDHFKPYFLVEDENGVLQEKLYDLSPLFEFISSHPFSETKKRIMGDTQIFHTCKFDEESNIWELQMLHLREKILPGIADADGAFELIQLEENQYPAESTTLLYDNKSKILYMQRNLYGTSIRALEQYLEKISPEGIQVLLKPMLVGAKISTISESKKYRKLILVADSDQLDQQPEYESLRSIIKTFSQYQGKYVKVELGFGHKRNSFLNPRTTTFLIKEAYSFPGTQNLKVSMTDNEDTYCETIDLMDNRATSKISISYSRENPITHTRLFKLCLEKIS